MQWAHYHDLIAWSASYYWKPMPLIEDHRRCPTRPPSVRFGPLVNI